MPSISLPSTYGCYELEAADWMPHVMAARYRFHRLTAVTRAEGHCLEKNE